MSFDIEYLPRDKWKGRELPFAGERRAYRVTFSQTDGLLPLVPESGCADADKALCADPLYENPHKDVFAWGIIDGGEPVAVLETVPDEITNRLYITKLWATAEYREKGALPELLSVAREQARLERRRAVILLANAGDSALISFCLGEGFVPSGFDSCRRSNAELESGNAMLEFALPSQKKKRIAAGSIELRRERPEDEHMAELLTQRAFWNRHAPGCNEHYLVKKLRESEDYLPELSLVALHEGQPVGLIMYSRASVITADGEREVVSFGPLAVDPDWHGRGVGGLLLRESLKLAAKAGYPGVIILGEPDYYPLFGFQTCDKYGITTMDGQNFDAFMAYELKPHGFDDIKGKFHESEVFERLPADEVESFNAGFPPMVKRRFPKQWV